MDITNTVAVNAKAIRESKKLTLDAAAELTGVSRSMLAQIEKGDVNPTISVLWKMANGYKVSFTTLVEDKKSAADLHRMGQPLTEDNGRYLNYPTFGFDEARGFECYRIVIREGGSLSAQPHLRGAEEYITVFAGEVEITAGETAYRLEEGDSIRFCADVAHSYCNIGPGTAQMSMMIYYSK